MTPYKKRELLEKCIFFVKKIIDFTGKTIKFLTKLKAIFNCINIALELLNTFIF